jgi:hypothetical protein
MWTGWGSTTSSTVCSTWKRNINPNVFGPASIFWDCKTITKDSMKRIIEAFKALNERRKQSWIYGTVLGVSLFVILLAVLASIKIINYKEYVDVEAGFKMKYPVNWTVIRRPEGGAVVAFVSPKATEWDPYLENVNITIQPLWEPMDLNKFSEVATKQLTGTFKELIKVQESKRASMAGRPAFRLVYVGNVKGPIKFMHVWVLKNNQGYIFTYSAAAQDVDKYRRFVQGMIKSFQFI